MSKAGEIIAANAVFAEEMLERMLQKMDEGYTGWDGSGEKPVNDVYLVVRVKEKIQKGTMTAQDWVDVANFAMMGWHLCGR